MGVDYYSCINCDECVHSDYIFHFEDNEFIHNMIEILENNENEHLRTYLVDELKIEIDDIKYILNKWKLCDHEFCDNCFDFDFDFDFLENDIDEDFCENFKGAIQYLNEDFFCYECDTSEQKENSINFKKETCILLKWLKMTNDKKILDLVDDFEIKTKLKSKK